MSDVIVEPADQSTFPDTGDTTKFGPNWWNRARKFSGGVDGQIVTKSAASATGAAWVDSIPTTRTVNGHALSADVIVTKGDLGLGNVENTALSTWGGSANLVTLGAATAASLAVTGALTTPIGATGNKTFLQATLSDAGFVGHYSCCVGSIANTFDGARNDHVLTMGYNTKPGGGQAVAGEPTFEWRIEDYYLPSAGVKWLEAHWSYYDQVGAAFRPIALFIDRTAAGSYVTSATMSLQASSLSYLAMDTTQYVRFAGSVVSLLNSASIQAVANNYVSFYQYNAAGNHLVELAYVNSSDQVVLGNAAWAVGGLLLGQSGRVTTINASQLNLFSLNANIRLLNSGTGNISLEPSATGGITFGRYFEGTEMTAPAAGAVNTGRLYFEDNGSGKTRLMCLFNTGAAQQIAIQP